MTDPSPDHTLEFLLAFDGRTHWLDQYSFTLHDPDGNRLVGFDNAHTAPVRGARGRIGSKTADHWHRMEGDKGRPYRFEGADKLLGDFFGEVHRVLCERGISDEVRGVSEDGDERS